jgi:hypothetical protein
MEDNSKLNTAPPARLVDEEITDQNKALSLLVSFITVAQKRGAFTLEESSKIWECVKAFSG